MPTEKKEQIVKDLEETMKKSSIIVLSDYRGVSAAKLTGLRRRLKASNSELKVVKNTLARLAAKQAGWEVLVPSLKGTTALTFGYGDIAAPVKTLASFQTEAEGFTIRGGMLGSKLYAKDEIMGLATLPSREVLLGRVLGQMTAPISMLLGSLSSPMRGFLGILQGRITQLEEK
jgi:large subunit ribosomal protein L10